MIDYKKPTMLDVPLSRRASGDPSGNGAYGAAGISTPWPTPPSSSPPSTRHRRLVDPPATPDKVLQALASADNIGIHTIPRQKPRRVTAAHGGNREQSAIPATCASEMTPLMQGAAERAACNPSCRQSLCFVAYLNPRPCDRGIASYHKSNGQMP
jgi:hypothetical protein